MLMEFSKRDNVGWLARALSGWLTTGQQLEHWIVVPQLVMIVLIRVAGQDAVDPHPHHLGKGVVDEGPKSRIAKRAGEFGRQPNLLVELPDRQQAGVAGQMLFNRLHDDRFGAQKIE